MATKSKTARFDQKKGVRKLARERVGAVPPSHAIQPKDKRKKPKYKNPADDDAA